MFGLSLGEMDVPPQTMPGVVLAPVSSPVAPGEMETYTTVNLWDSVRLIGQPGVDEEPQSFLIFSAKKSQSSSGLSLFNNKVQNSQQAQPEKQYLRRYQMSLE